MLRVLTEHAPDCTLVGSFARDYRCHTIAKLPMGSLTLDIDIAILVESLDHYWLQLKSLSGPNANAIHYRVQGYEVDVIPYGPTVAPGGILEAVEGATLDVTGMAESADHAEVVELGNGTTIKVPTLSSLIGLKLIAWNYRRAGKDARDLALLLKATYHGPHGEELWKDEEAGTRWDYDPQRVGPYRAGVDLCVHWRQESVQRLIDILADSTIPELATHIKREADIHSAATSVEEFAAQLEALRAGIADF